MENYFYVDNNLNLVEASKAEIVDIFAEDCTTPYGIGKRFFYDKETQTIQEWMYGKAYTVCGGFKYSEEEAEEELFKFALIDAENSENRFFLPETAEDLIETIQNYIENAIDEDDENDKEIFEKLKECETALKLAVSQKN